MCYPDFRQNSYTKLHIMLNVAPSLRSTTQDWHSVLTKPLVPLRLAEGTVLHPWRGHGVLSPLTARRHRHFT